MTRDDWKNVYELRNDMEDPEDRALLRRLIKHTEKLERVITTVTRVVDTVEITNRGEEQ